MSQQKSVLVVEDEAMIGMMLEDFLDALDYRLHDIVASVSDGQKAVAQGGFDAAILDCNLAGEKVWPVAHDLVEKGIPFLFATGGVSDDVPTEFHGRPTLAKPYTMGAVERALEKLLGE